MDKQTIIREQLYDYIDFLFGENGPPNTILKKASEYLNHLYKEYDVDLTCEFLSISKSDLGAAFSLLGEKK